MYLEFPATKCCFEIEAGEGCHAVVRDGKYRFETEVRKFGRGEERRICLFIPLILMMNQNT